MKRRLSKKRAGVLFLILLSFPLSYWIGKAITITSTNGEPIDIPIYLTWIVGFVSIWGLVFVVAAIVWVGPILTKAFFGWLLNWLFPKVDEERKK